MCVCAVKNLPTKVLYVLNFCEVWWTMFHVATINFLIKVYSVKTLIPIHKGVLLGNEVVSQALSWASFWDEVFRMITASLTYTQRFDAPAYWMHQYWSPCCNKLGWRLTQSRLKYTVLLQFVHKLACMKNSPNLKLPPKTVVIARGHWLQSR